MRHISLIPARGLGRDCKAIYAGHSNVSRAYYGYCHPVANRIRTGGEERKVGVQLACPLVKRRPVYVVLARGAKSPFQKENSGLVHR